MNTTTNQQAERRVRIWTKPYGWFFDMPIPPTVPLIQFMNEWKMQDVLVFNDMIAVPYSSCMLVALMSYQGPTPTPSFFVPPEGKPN